MIWPDALQHGRKADPFTSEQRACMTKHARAIAHAAKAGGTMSLEVGGKWFVVVEKGRILNAPKSSGETK